MQTETAPTSLKIQLLQMVRKESGEFYPVKFGLEFPSEVCVLECKISFSRRCHVSSLNGRKVKRKDVYLSLFYSTAASSPIIAVM